MNKARRHEVKMLKYKKRIKQLNLQNSEGKFYAYRSHGAPCSCSMCSHTKHSRNQEKRELKEIWDSLKDFEIEYDLKQ